MPKPYSVDLREKVLEYLKKVKNKKAASKIFGVGIATVYRWVAQYKKKGNVKPKKKLHSFKRVDLEELKIFIENNPDLFLSEIGEHFSVSPQAIFYACKRAKITRKKRRPSI